jgi:hypothetical protein
MSVGRALCWITCVVALCFSGRALAQDSAALQREFDSVYQQVLFKPADRALNQRLIDLAVALQDYDAAIGAIERLIFNDPTNADLYLEAARLYLKIQSPAAAKGYLDDALMLPAIAPATRGEAIALLDQIDRGNRKTGWSGMIQAGARFQSNANVGSTEPGPLEPFPFETPVPDYNAFVLGTVGVVRPFAKNAAFELSASGYVAEQAKVDRLDLAFAELTGGPRLQTEGGKLWVKPYGLLQGVLLGGHAYQLALGGGATARWMFGGDQWWLEPSFEYKNRHYYNSADYTQATDQTGNLFTYAMTVGHRVAEGMVVNKRVMLGQNSAAAAYNSYDQYLANVSAVIDLQDAAGRPWTISPFASVSAFQYKGQAPPEQFIGPEGKIRKDLLWAVGTNVETPFIRNSRLGVQFQYSENDSNLDRYTYKNFLIMVGPLARF